MNLGMLPTWEQRNHLRIRSLSSRLQLRASQLARDKEAPADPERIQLVRKVSRTPEDLSRRELNMIWERLDRHNKRIIQVPQK